MILRCHDKRRCGKYITKPCWEIIPGLLSTVSWKMAGRDRNLPRGHLHDDVPWEVQMDKSGGGQRVGTQWLRKAIHPCNNDKTNLSFHSRNKMSSVIFFEGPTASSTCRTALTRSTISQKAQPEDGLLTSSQEEQVSQSQTTNSLRRMKWNQPFCSTSTGMEGEDFTFEILEWCKQSIIDHFYPFQSCQVILGLMYSIKRMQIQRQIL